jgi:peptidyl-prolyl cis-trans isomerase B (cyclophilin B)
MTNHEVRMPDEAISTNIAAGQPLLNIHHQLSILLIILSLLLLISCGRSRARRRLAQDEFFIEILKRENRRWIGEDQFFENCLLRNAYPEVRKWSAIALGRIGSPRALPMLYKALKTGDAAVRAASAFAIGEIEDRELLKGEFLAPNLEAATELIHALDDPSIIVKIRAVEALGKIGSHSEALEISRQLEGFHFTGAPVARLYLNASITALGKLGDPIARPVIEKLAVTSDRDIKQRALEALTRIASKASIPLSKTPALKKGSFSPAIRSATDIFCRVLAANRKNRTIARLETNRGAMEIELFREKAPATATNFILMAKGGDYNGMRFDSVIPHCFIEGTSLKVRSGHIRAIPEEVNMQPFERGNVGMGLINGYSETGQFFIALAPQPYLDGIYTCFGRVISGMQIADRIVPGDLILKVSIKETISSLDYQTY